MSEETAAGLAEAESEANVPKTAVPAAGDGGDGGDSGGADPQPAAQDFRLTASVLLLGGLLLALFSVVTAGHTEGGEQIIVYLLAAMGVVAFLLGGSTAVQGELPAWLSKVTAYPARTFEISTGQVILLLFAFCFSLLARFAAGDALLARVAPVATLAWIMALACAAIGALGKESLDDFPITWSDIYFTAFLFGAALFVRGLATELIPFTFSGDEGSAALTAAQFADGSANNLFSVGWFEFPSLYFALQGLGIGLFGHTVPAVRLVAAMGGALTIVAVYWLARVTFDVTMARIASLILLASHYHVHMSRIALNNIWDALFAALTVAGLWYGWKSGRHLGFIFAGLCLGLGQYFYVTMRIMPIVFLVWAICAFFFQRAQFQRRLPGLILTAYLALVTVLPLGLYYANHTDQLNARSNFVTIFGRWMENETATTGLNSAQIVAVQFSKAARGLVNEPLRMQYNPGAPLLLGVAATLFVIGFLWAVYDFDLRYLLLLLPILATLIVLTISQDTPASQRFILAIPFVVIFVALPVGLLTDWLRKLWPQHRQLALLPAILLLAWIMVSESGYYFTEVYDGFILGGTNTVVATKVADRLQDEDPPPQVVFYGFPRMGFTTHSTIPYLAPDVQGWDVPAGALYPNNWSIDGRTQFIFLPERLSDLEAVRHTFPGGRYEEIWDDKGQQLLFAIYTAE